MFTFNKKERLKSQKVIGKLFENGKSFLIYPIKTVFLETDNPDKYPVQAAFSVSKKNFKKAVKRNLIKRRLKEAYRLNKPDLYSQLGEKQIAVMFVYIAKEILPYSEIEKVLKKSLQKIIHKI